MCTSRIDFDVFTGRLPNQGYFQGIYCNKQTTFFIYSIATPAETIVFTQFVVLQYIQLSPWK